MKISTSHRIDRIVSVYITYPFIRSIRLNGKGNIPILMYHSISEDMVNSRHPYYWTNTSPSIFTKHIKYLYENNYTLLSLRDVRKHIELKKEIAEKCVVITFDDGFRDFYRLAFPILQEYGFAATVFLPTRYIDNQGPGLTKKEHLSWNEVRELHKHGTQFGSHTVTHPQLKCLSKKNIVYEVKHSKEIIENNIGERVDTFSYPFAFPEQNRPFREYLRRCLLSCGYRMGVSTRIGTSNKIDDLFFLKRIPINSSDDIQFLKTKIAGGYNWLHRLQYFSKAIRSFRYYGVIRGDQKGRKMQTF